MNGTHSVVPNQDSVIVRTRNQMRLSSIPLDLRRRSYESKKCQRRIRNAWDVECDSMRHKDSQLQPQVLQIGFRPLPAPPRDPYPVRRSHPRTQPSRAHVARSSGAVGDQLMSVTARV